MITLAELDKARVGIEKLFVQHSATGPDAVLSTVDQEASAAGQHIPGRTSQRGLHGTAAAIRVLAQSNDPAAPNLTRKMIYYVSNRAEIEARIGPDDQIVEAQLLQDAANVIKISELLFALSFVSTSIAPREGLAHTLAEQLANGRTGHAGWSYLLTGPSTKTALLPTAHAVLALAAHGYPVEADLEYLRTHLRMSAETPASQTDISVQVMAFYVLCFASESASDDKELNLWFDRLWARLAPLLDQDLEANIEYEVGNSVSYVRVPWQLYLLACASRLSPYVRFANGVVQRRLNSILSSIANGRGLIYPHSGQDPSTRTNGIVHEVLGRIQRELRLRRFPLRPFEILDRGRAALTSKYSIWTARAVIAVFIVISVVQWFSSNSRTVSALAPDFITAALLLLLTGRRER